MIDDASEHWRPVLGYEGLYEVSDRGHVRSLDRQIIIEMPGGYKTASGPTVRTYRGKTLKWWPGTDGYPQVTLSRPGAHRHFRVHILVLEAFAGPCPPGQEARHGPAGKADPSLANLRGWGTRQENIMDRVRDGTDNRGERHGRALLTQAQVDAIRERWAAGETQRSLAAEFGTTFGNIHSIVRGKSWSYD